MGKNHLVHLVSFTTPKSLIQARDINEHSLKLKVDWVCDDWPHIIARDEGRKAVLQQGWTNLSLKTMNQPVIDAS